MSPEIITLIINVILGVFVLFGFLFGLKGIKKSTYSLCVLIITLIVVFIFSPMVTKALLKISINGEPIDEMLFGEISSAVGEDLSSTSLITNVVSGLPLMVINIVTTILMIIVVGFVFKIIGAIVYRIIFKKEKQKEVEKCEMVNGQPQMVKVKEKKKKYRLWGGLVGAVRGLVLALALFLPILGLVNIFNDLTADVSAETQTEETFTLKKSNQLLNDIVPKEVNEYIDAVSDSIFYKIGSIANLSEATFNLTARTSINKTGIMLGKEIKNLVSVYDEFVDFAYSGDSNLNEYTIDAIFDDIKNNPEKYDYQKLENALLKLNNSGLFVALHDDMLKFVGDIIVQTEDGKEPDNLVVNIKDALYHYADTRYTLADDMSEFVNVFETCAKSGLLKQLLNSETIYLKDVKDIIINKADPTTGKTENEVLNNITASVARANFLQFLTSSLINYGIDELQTYLNNNLLADPNNKVSIVNINLDDNLTISSQDMSLIVVDGLKIFEQVSSFNTEAIQEDFFNIFDEDIESLVEQIGETLNSITNISLLKDSGVFNSLCDAMTKTTYNTYISFSAFKNKDVFASEFSSLAEVVNVLKESEAISIIREINSKNSKDKVYDLFESLAEKQNGKTYVEQILEPMLKCTIFKNTLTYGLSKANDYLEQQFITLSGDQNFVLSDFNTSKLMTEGENQKIITIVNELINFASQLQSDDLSKDNFVTTIIESDDDVLAGLGNAFQTIKTTTLFSDINGNDGVYKNMMDALSNSEFSEYFDLSVAKEEDFEWTTTIDDICEIREDLNSITVGTDPLLTYILTSGDLNNLYASIQGKEVELTKVFELDIIKPTAVSIVNIINSEIKGFVGETLGSQIPEDIGNNAKLFEQAQNINDIINSALKIDYESINAEGYEITSEDQQKIDELLENLRINAGMIDDKNNPIGVFKEAYNAVLIKSVNLTKDKIKNIVGETIGANIQEITSLEDVDVESLGDVIDSGFKIFEKLDQNDEDSLKDLYDSNDEDVNNFLQNLNNDQTKDAYDAIMEYLGETGE